MAQPIKVVVVVVRVVVVVVVVSVDGVVIIFGLRNLTLKYGQSQVSNS